MIFFTLVLIIGYVVFYNHRTYKSISNPTITDIHRSSKVSLIIPAKNEGTKIGQLLSSIDSKYIDEIIVVNDDSSDNTEIVVKKFKHVKLINVTNKPKGYLGKNYALLKGYHASTNDNLLFLDADTYITNSLNFDKLILDFLQNREAVYSVLPFHETKSAIEKLSCFFCIVVAMAFTRFNFNNTLHGSCILISKSNYEKIGTHKNVKTEVVEDMAIARLLKQNNIEIKRFIGKGSISFRMYTNISEIIEGWSKNIAKGFKYNNTINTVMIVVFICSVFVLLNISAKYISSNLAYSLTTYLSLCLCIYLYSHKIMNLRVLDSLLTVLYSLFFLVVFIYSVYLIAIRKKVKWKDVDIVIDN